MTDEIPNTLSKATGTSSKDLPSWRTENIDLDMRVDNAIREVKRSGIVIEFIDAMERSLCIGRVLHKDNKLSNEAYQEYEKAYTKVLNLYMDSEEEYLP